MSTGLTWIIVGDNSNTNEPYFDAMYQFADYNEAYKWAEWTFRAYNQTIGVPGFKILIYTTSPNNNGFFYWTSGAVGFIAYD